MKKWIFTIVASVAILFTLAMSVSASSRSETIAVAAGQVWNNRPTNITRNRNVNFVRARARAVYPTGGGTDNFTRIQVRVLNTSGQTISEPAVTVLHETNTAPTNIRIANGHSNTATVRFSFRGNDPNHAARADVWYNGGQ